MILYKTFYFIFAKLHKTCYNNRAKMICKGGESLAVLEKLPRSNKIIGEVFYTFSIFTNNNLDIHITIFYCDRNKERTKSFF